MSLSEAVPFAASAVVLLWALASAGMALTGGGSSGLHQVAHHEPGDDLEPAQPVGEPQAETRRPRRPRLPRIGGRMDMDDENMTIAKIGNYALAFAVLGALVLMIIGALVA